MLDAQHVHMPAKPRFLAILCLLVHCSCSHSLESCKSSEIEHEETSTLVTHLARQLGTNVSAQTEVSNLLIPRKLLFNYKKNLFKAEPGDLSKEEKMLLANMKRTVTVFQNFAGDAPEVHMWDDHDCFTAIHELQMKEGHQLALYFDREDEGRIKSDVCRLVMLYNMGGLYFDTDVAPLAALPRTLDPRATFVTVKVRDGNFFQAFLATSPKHPVIRMCLTKFKTWYDELWKPGQDQKRLRKETGGGNIGTALLARSFKEWSASTSQDDPLLAHQGGHVSQFFQEWQFKMQDQGVTPRQPGTFSYRDFCDWGAMDSRTHTMVMISRVYDERNSVICQESTIPTNFLANFLGLSLP